VCSPNSYLLKNKFFILPSNLGLIEKKLNVGFWGPFFGTAIRAHVFFRSFSIYFLKNCTVKVVFPLPQGVNAYYEPLLKISGRHLIFAIPLEHP